MEITRTKQGYALGKLETRGLAPRESQALLFKAAGLTNLEAAQVMGCKEQSVSARIQNLYYKMRARNLAQLMANALNDGKLILNYGGAQ